MTLFDLVFRVMLVPGSSHGRRAVATVRIGYHEPTLEVPASAHEPGLMVDRSSILPFCVIIGVLVRLGEASQ